MHSLFLPLRPICVCRACLPVLAALFLLTPGVRAAETPAAGATAHPAVQALHAAPPTPAPPQAAPAVQTASAMPGVPETARAASETEVPFQMDWLLDVKGTHTMGDMLATDSQKAFKPYRPDNLPHQTGTLWLRITPQGGTPDIPLVLDLNTRISGQLPGTPQVWLARVGEPNGTPVRPSSEGLYHLPSPLPAQTNIYVRVSGIPAPGFLPMLRNVTDLTVFDELGTQPQLALLAGLLILCLLRGIAERREWRMWAALYIAAVWVQAFWGLPTTPAGEVSRWDMPGLLAPGVALLILPHVGRHMMRTRLHAHFVDMQFILLALCGIALSAAPLIPGYTWTLQFLPLWPLFTLLLLPGTLAACIRRLPGAKRFFLISLFPPLGMLAMFPLSRILPESILAMMPRSLDMFMTPGVISIIPLTCMALSALVAAVSPSPRALPSPSRRNAREQAAPAKTGRAAVAAMELGGDMKQEPIAEQPIVSVDPTQLGEMSFTPPTAAARAQAAAAAPSAATSVYPKSLQAPLTVGTVEDALRQPMDDLLRAISALDQSALPLEARRRTDTLCAAGRTLAKAIGGMDHLQTSAPQVDARERFDINQLLLDVHEAVADLAESKNISLSWFTAPHLTRCYEGSRSRLAETLSLLAESAVLATERGMVQIRAQRQPDSTDPGHLLFTVSDTGSGMPPFKRSTLAFVRAWELAGQEGMVSLESNARGTTISFSTNLIAQSAEQPSAAAEPDAEALSHLPASALGIIVASSVPANRQLLSFYLDELPHKILEARTPDEALDLYRRYPGALIIFDDDMPEDAIAEAVAAIRIFEGEHNFPLTCILALVNNDAQIDSLRRAGCTHFLKKPINRKGLRHLTLRLAPVSRKFRDPAPEKPLPVQAATQPLQTARGPNLAAPIPDLPELTPEPATVATAPQHKGLFSSLFAPFHKKPSAAQEPSATSPVPADAHAGTPSAGASGDTGTIPRAGSAGPAQTTAVPDAPAQNEPAETVPTDQPGVPAGSTCLSAQAGGQPEKQPDAATAESAIPPTSPQPSVQTPVQATISDQPEPSVPEPAVPEPAPAAPVPVASPVVPAVTLPPLTLVPGQSGTEPAAPGGPTSTTTSAASASEEEPLMLTSPILPSDEPVTLTERVQPKMSSVGEPVPVIRTGAPEPRRRPDRPNPLEERAKRTPAHSSAPASAAEWVGEPMPILKEERTGTPERSSAEQDTTPARNLTEQNAAQLLNRPFTPPKQAPQPASTPVSPQPAAAEKAEPLLLEVPLSEGMEEDADVLLLDSPVERPAGQNQTPELKSAPAPNMDIPDLFGPAGTDISGRTLLDEAAHVPPCAQSSRPEQPADPLHIDEEIVDLGAPLEETAATEQPQTPAQAVQPIPSETPSPASTTDLPAEQQLGQEPQQAPAAQPIPPMPSSSEEEPEQDASDEAIHTMLRELDAALERAVQGDKAGDAEAVCKAAGEIGRLAETYDLRTLDDPARCLEEAARAGRMDEVAQLVPDLVSAVTLNRDAFKEQTR